MMDNFQLKFQLFRVTYLFKTLKKPTGVGCNASPLHPALYVHGLTVQLSISPNKYQPADKTKKTSEMNMRIQ